MATPVLHPDNVKDGTGPGLTYRIEGTLVPSLHMRLDGQMGIFFEHHVILWKQPSIDIDVMKLGKSFTRAISGLNVFMTRAEGTGDIAFSRDTPGQVFALHLAPGEKAFVREHQFLAATENTEYGFERVKGVASMMVGNQGFFVDHFTGGAEGSIVWLHAYGNAYDIVLADGETIDVEPGAWIYRDPTVTYEQKLIGLKAGILGGGGTLIFNRFRGPGRVGLQSGFFAVSDEKK
ncbi:MAG: AIM24 family protein [Actinomycetes bacterium]